MVPAVDLPAIGFFPRLCFGATRTFERQSAGWLWVASIVILCSPCPLGGGGWRQHAKLLRKTFHHFPNAPFLRFRFNCHTSVIDQFAGSSQGLGAPLRVGL
jgi:hypothetical protein